MITVCVPYIPSVWKELPYEWDDRRFEFQQAVDIPVMQGGKEPSVCGDTVLSLSEAEEAMKLLGPRFRILANSCFPRINRDVLRLCEMIVNYGSGITVTDLPFARHLRQLFPSIKLHSSVIMNFYEDIDTICTSNLFDSIGGSEFYNDDTQKMIDVIPEKYRDKVQYILLGCVWRPECIAHYEIPSLMWRYPEAFKEFKFGEGFCHGRKGHNIDIKKLIAAGFTKFKFGYRTPSAEEARYTLGNFFKDIQHTDHASL